jgi:hypothetical protein
MKNRLIIPALLLSMLANNAALAGVLWLDQNRAAAGMAEHAALHTDSGKPANGGGDKHKDHATHCCHLQAHFQTLSVDNNLVPEADVRGDWLLQAGASLHSLTSRPPTPPPKA